MSGARSVGDLASRSGSESIRKISGTSAWRVAVCALVFALPAVFGCGGGSDDDHGDLSSDACGVLGLKIIDGTECKTEGSPVVGFDVFYTNRAATSCSGTMITPSIVLTAAHCFADFGDHVNRIRVTFHDTAVDASAFGIHPNYSEQSANVPGGILLYNDVAIVEVKGAPSVPTLPLLLSRPIQNNDVFSIFGYGLDENGEAGELRSGEMRVDSVFGNHFGAYFGGDGSNTCQGDSGGPAIMSVGGQNGIIGMTSSGDGSRGCLEGDFSVFSNVQHGANLQFIRSVAPGVGEI